jgi:uncharacterized protein YjbI with pentapeptide repeats
MKSFRPGGLLIMTLLVLLTLARPASLAAQPRRPSAGKPTVGEKHLMEQVTAGKVADLGRAFADETNRVVRAAFLEELLMGARTDCDIHRNGVIIEGIVVREPVDLRNVKIPHDVRLANCRFEGEVNFSKSEFENALSLEGSTFAAPASFYAMKVSRGVLLNGTVFRSRADFTQAQIAGSLLAGGVQFMHPELPADFVSLRVGGAAHFTNALFAGPANFQYSHTTEALRFDDAKFSSTAALACFEAMRVDGAASFNGATVAGYLSLKGATCNSIDLSSVHWPESSDREWLWLNGLEYQRIVSGSERESAANLLALVDRAAHGSAYSMDIYTRLAGFYRRDGYPRQANQFYIAQKRRERTEVLHGANRAWSLFLDVFVGYGRSPERAFLWSLVIVLFGTVVFRPKHMEPRNPGLSVDAFSPFWYSLDLFLPLVKLQDADFWKPREHSRLPRFWSRFHTMLGWALIPIAVAAWTGMLEQ